MPYRAVAPTSAGGVTSTGVSLLMIVITGIFV